MKIKPRNKRKAPTHVFFDGQWIPFVTQRKAGRLKQLNKHNKRTPSEFIRLCDKIEANAT